MILYFSVVCLSLRQCSNIALFNQKADGIFTIYINITFNENYLLIAFTVFY